MLRRAAKSTIISALILILINSFVLAGSEPIDFSIITSTKKAAISNEISSEEGASVENSLFIGAATYSLPIEIPPGRLGLTPKVKLIYNSYKKNGWLGIGWDIDVGHIRRSTKYSIDYSSNDFETNINGQIIGLVAAQAWGANYYRAKIEDSFKKFHFISSASVWIVTDRDGIEYHYGTTEASRQSDPGDDSRVYKWCLDKIIDRNGNYITFYYTKDQGQIYLDRIEYTGNDESSSVGPTNFIIFHLEDGRPDQEITYTTNFRVVSAKRLNFIEIKADTNIVGRYEFKYEMSPNSKRSILADIQQVGGYGTPLPKIDLTYRNNSIDFENFGSLIPDTHIDNSPDHSLIGDYNGDNLADIVFIEASSGYNKLFQSNGDGTFQYFSDPLPRDYVGEHCGDVSEQRVLTGDFNCDGLTDIFLHSNCPEYNVLIQSNGDGTFQCLEYAIADHHNLIDEPDYVLTGDFNGDGRSDLYFTWRYSGLNRLFISNGDGTFQYFSNPILVDYISGSIASGDGLYDVLTSDFNGDGRSDLYFIRRGGRPGNMLFQSNGDGTFQYFQNPIPHEYVGVSIAHRKFYVGDFNGDGLSDLFFFWYSSTTHPTTSNKLFISKGNGYFEYVNGPLPDDFNGWEWEPGNVLTNDFNGDGLSDLYFFGRKDPKETEDRARNRLCISNGDGTFQYFLNPIPLDDIDCHCPFSWRILIGDYNGDGLSDLYFHWSDPGINRLFLNNGDDGSLLSSISQYATEKLEYVSSSAFDNSSMPFSLNLLSKIEKDDGNGVVSTTLFDYKGGLYDFATRDFRGFTTVTQTNPDGTTIETRFHQDELRKGRIYQVDVREPSPGEGALGNLILHSTTSWEIDYLDAPNNSSGFIKLVQKRTEHDGNSDLFTQEDYTYDIDIDGPGENTAGLLRESLKTGTDAENITYSRTYVKQGDWLWRINSESITGNASGKVRETTYDYYADGTGNLQYKTLWYADNPDESPRIEYGYDDYGNITSEIDAKLNTTTTTYDAKTQTFPATVTHPSTNGVVHVEVYGDYDYRFGKPKTIRDQNGQPTYNDYDEFGRLIQVDTPDGGQTFYLYDDYTFPRSITTRIKEAEGSFIEIKTYFDGLDRKVQTVKSGEGANYIVTKTHYDNMGLVDFQSGPFFQQDTSFLAWNGYTYQGYTTHPGFDYPYVHTAFDKRSRPQIVTSRDGQNGLTDTSYAYSGFAVTITDPDKCAKTEIHDHLERIVEVIDHPDTGDIHTRYVYNAAGDLLEVRNHFWSAGAPDENRALMKYDSLGRKTHMDDPDMGQWDYQYDANGNMVLQTDAKGNRIQFDYDELNRIKLKDYLDTAEPSVTYQYDQAVNGIGRLCLQSNSDVTTVYHAYDEMGRATKMSKTITGTVARTTLWDYDYSGKVKRLTYPHTKDSSLFHVDYAFHPGTSLVHTVTGSDGTVYATVTDYEPNTKIGRIDFGNGVYANFGYDRWSQRLNTIRTIAAEGAVAQDRQYTYSPAGDITEIDDQAKVETYFYGYDKMHRLTSETTSTGSVGVIPAIIEMQYDDPDHIHAVSSVNLKGASHAYTYDENGNQQSGPDLTDPMAVVTRNLAYNADNMPISVAHPNGRTISLIYDGESQRVKKTSACKGKKTYYFSNEFEIIDNVETFYIFAGNLRIAMVKNNTPVYFHKVHLGSSTAMTDTDGYIIETAMYMPFGGKRGDAEISASGYKFTDQELDKESGLYNYDARLYDPIVGRFISADSLVPNWYASQAFDRFAYSFNNPIKYNDPSGHDPQPEDDMEEDFGEPISTTDCHINWTDPEEAKDAAEFVYNLTPVADYQSTIKSGLDLIQDPLGLDAWMGVGLAAIGYLPGLPSGKSIAKAVDTVGDAAKRTSSRAARREVMRQQGIPTSQKPLSQYRNESGRSYEYNVPKPGGGTQTMSVQQQTMDHSHPGQGHWEAGSVKTDPISGQVRMNQYGRPKLTNDKSKVNYYE